MTPLGPVNMDSQCSSYTVIEVLEFLKGKPWGNEAKSFVSALRPSCVVICRKSIDLMAVNWRVRVWLNDDDTIRHIEQEVAVNIYSPITHDERGIPDCANGGDLNKWLRT